MKKLTLISSLVSLSLIFSVTAEQVGDFTIERFHFDDSIAYIVKYTGSGGDVFVPATLAGASIYTIAGSAFTGTAATSVTIEEGIAALSSYAFANCPSLNSVTIPASVIDIGVSLFENCTALTNVTINSPVTEIPNGSFKGCTSLTTYTIPSTVTAIGTSSFESCTALSDVTFPPLFTTIYYFAFSNCTALVNIDLPPSLTTIERRAFQGCTALRDITLPGSLSSVGDNAFTDCTSLTNVTITAGATSFSGWRIFEGCPNLTTVSIPGSMAKVAHSMFNECHALTTVNFGSGVTGIGDMAFGNCTALESITLPDTLNSIGNSSFKGCSNLTSIHIPGNNTTVGDSAFEFCTNLRQATFANGVIELGLTSFAYCTNLLSIAFPPSLMSPGAYTFRQCFALTNVTINAPLTSLPNGIFQACTSLANLAIPETVTAIGQSALSGLPVYNLTLPKNLTSIGRKALANCFNLSHLIIPANVTTIESYAFDRSGTPLALYFMGSRPQSIGATGEILGHRSPTFYYLAESSGWPLAESEYNEQIWAATVTFDSQGGAPLATLNIPVGTTAPPLPTATRTGYTFNGWWTKPLGQGSEFTTTTVIPIAINSNFTLYATWHKTGTTPDPDNGDTSGSNGNDNDDNNDTSGDTGAPEGTDPDGNNGTLWTNHLCTPHSGAPLSDAGTFDGFLYASTPSIEETPTTTIHGTLSLKLRQTARATNITAKAMLQIGNLSFKAKEWTTTLTNGTRHAVLSTRTGEELELFMRQDRLWGTLSGGRLTDTPLALDGSRNIFIERGNPLAATTLERFNGTYAISLPPYKSISADPSIAATPLGAGYLSVTIRSRGAVRIAGILADGTRVSRSARLIPFTDCGELAAIPLFTPLYAKRGSLGGLLWANPETNTITTEHQTDWFIRWENPGRRPGTGFNQLLEVCGGRHSMDSILALAPFTLSSDLSDTAFYVEETPMPWVSLPLNIPINAVGSRLIIDKGTRPKKISDRTTGTIWYEYHETNPTAATFSLAARTGIFKGKLTLWCEYTDSRERLILKNTKISYGGIIAPIRDPALTTYPVAMGHALLNETNPDLRHLRLKKSYPVWLD